MLPSAHLPWFRRRAAWLLACGLFVMALQVFGGNVLMRQHFVADGFHVEICTTTGSSKADPARQSGNSSLPGSGHSDCCKLCATTLPALAVDAVPGVPSAPTVATPFVESGFMRLAALAGLSHPPRGPPSA